MLYSFFQIRREIARQSLGVRLLLFGLSYCAAGWVGNTLSLEISGFTYFWPPCGLFLAVLVSVPKNEWPMFVLAGMISSYLVGMLFGVFAPLNTVFAVANASEAVVGAWAICRFVKPRLDLSTLRETMIGLLLIGAFTSSVIAALIGATAATAVHGTWDNLLLNWYDWWMGNALGTITIAPVILTWPRADRQRLGAARFAEAVFLVALFILGAVAFLVSDEKSYNNYLYMFIPLMVWAAIRFSLFGCSTASLALLLVVIGATRNIMLSTDHQLFLSSARSLQVFALLMVSMNLMLSALMAERKHAEDALRESKLRLDTILDNVGASIFIKDPQYRYAYVNRKCSELFGCSEQEIIGKDDSVFFSADSLDTIMKSDRGVLELGESVRREETVAVLHENALRTYWTVKIPLRNTDGIIYGLCGISTDITELKSLEENLNLKTVQLENELAERMMVEEALQDQAATLEEEVEERRRAEEMLQRSEATIRNKLKAIVEPEGDFGALELADIIDCDMLRDLLNDFYSVTGILGAVLDTSGKVLVAVGWQDICTKFHRCHPETLKNCIESDTLLTKDVPVGTFRRYHCKNNMWDMVTPLEVGGRHIGNVFIGQFFYEDEEPDRGFFLEQAGRYGFDEREYLAALDRAPRFTREKADAGMRFYAKLTKMISELSLSSIKLSRILNERIQLEEQLRQSQKMEVIGQLAGGVAHDFNNILQVISGYGCILQMDNLLSSRQKERVAQILSAVDKGAQLTNGLLAFSRKQVMTLATVDLNDIVMNVKKFLVRIIGEDILLETTTYGSQLNIKADVGQIEQVLINLATNARDAMQKGGKLHIATQPHAIDTPIDRESGSATHGNYALLIVSDTGCGMDQTTCGRIFEPFYTTKDVGKGTGLGMSIVYGIVKQHNGFINVYSEQGQGTVFKIYFPICEAASSENEKKVVHVPTPQGGTETILVAEDDDAVRDLVVSILTQFGYNVIQAVDGEDAVEKFAENREAVSMLLMDMIMPKKNGKEAYDAISLLRPNVKVLYSSGYTADFFQDRGLSEAGFELIMKPVHPMELLRKVRMILDQ